MTRKRPDQPATLVEFFVPPRAAEGEIVIDAPPYSDDAVATDFVTEHGEALRYVAAWNRWYRWTGEQWQLEATLAPFNLARAICRAVASETTNAQLKQRLCSAKTVAGVVSLARADRQIAATVDQWDQNLWLLNTPAGAVDLKSGNLRPNDPEDYSTKLAGASPGGHCPIWRAFLKRVTGGDNELEAFLQRVCGYCLTGVTAEHAMFFLFGRGANGKSVFITTISGAIGDYARSAPIETFTASQGERHPTDLASLRGARLVTAVETEEGRYWAESKIKTLTGGDRISARFMRQDFFEYTPQFKLLIAGNHKPRLRSVDEAIRRRFHLIPFTVTIPPEERDLKLAEKLRDEWPGILDWAIEGCLEWRRIGLAPPQSVIDATAEYMRAEDALGAWLEERCRRDSKTFTASSDLFSDWKRWAEAASEHAGTQRRFLENLEGRGFLRWRDRTQPGEPRGMLGIALLSRPETDAGWRDA